MVGAITALRDTNDVNEVAAIGGKGWIALVIRGVGESCDAGAFQVE